MPADQVKNGRRNIQKIEKNYSAGSREPCASSGAGFACASQT